MTKQPVRSVRIVTEVTPGGPTTPLREQVDRTVQTALNRRQAGTAPVVQPGGGISLAGLTSAILLAAKHNVVISLSGQTITIDGRLGPRFGYRYPANGENITIGDDDFAIYGTPTNRPGNVTFPPAASVPGKVVHFTVAPSGSLIAQNGTDSIENYFHETCIYQSDGVNFWKRLSSF